MLEKFCGTLSPYVILNGISDPKIAGINMIMSGLGLGENVALGCS